MKPEHEQRATELIQKVLNADVDQTLWPSVIRELSALIASDEALDLLKKCAERIKNGIVGIGSPMSETDVACALPKVKQGWVVGSIARPANFDVEAETLELAIEKFARRLFDKPQR